MSPVAGNFEQNSKHARAEGSGKLSNTSGTTFSLNFEGSSLAHSPSQMQQNPQAFFSHVKNRKHHAQRNVKLYGLLPQKLVLEPRILCCFWNRFLSEEKKDRESQQQQCVRVAPDELASGPFSLFRISSQTSRLRSDRNSCECETSKR
jgi:hypothetical protein